MKGKRLLFAVCLALLGFWNAWANDADDIARAAVRRGATNTLNTSRKKVSTPVIPSETNTVSRSMHITPQSSQTLRERTVGPRTGTVVSNTGRSTVINDTENKTNARVGTNILPRATITKPATTTKSGIARGAITPKKTATETISATTARTPSISRAAARRSTLARAASDVTPDQSELRNTILNTDNSKCRNVYYECMDEFCANKDSQLKRCACSARSQEFDSIRKQLESAEEKMLDFSQRLLTVGMDAEDAAALNVATEGEIAFNQQDKSESQKLLNDITKKLNTKFQDSSFERNLTAISLSLNEDAAFDNIDSLMGAGTVLKSGTALYSAALPTCREMAAEVCTPDQLAIAESGYQMLIEQDCNTVQKSYQTQTDQAREKVREGSALLDMSRLNIYQERNSDDILTCKKKMLNMLSSASICGTDLTKCLDTTGKYIDPSTGDAFLTSELINLDKLIIRPASDQKWTRVPENEIFVDFLDSKKTFLEPAMENCQDISDYVWDEFVEDALAQIKLAQSKKLEEIRQSCTTLTTQCMSETAKSLSEFDSRALSTFGVLSDATVNAMCADVKNACSALMDSDSIDDNWTQGMNQIATSKTYETIMQTCREVGRACIIQACKSVSGNFGLCEDIDTSVNRKSIVNATACWDEVYKCVSDAGTETIDNIMNQLVAQNVISAPTDIATIDNVSPIPAYAFYKKMYNATKVDNSSNCTIDTPKPGCIYDMCTQYKNNNQSTEYKTCRLTEQIWGNCEASPTTDLADAKDHNMIKRDNDESTLLYWFALNTGTNNIADSCRDTSCGPGYMLEGGICYDRSEFLDDGGHCSTKGDDNGTIPTVTGTKLTNCCSTKKKDSKGNCCMEESIEIPYHPHNFYYEGGIPDDCATCTGYNSTICIPKDKKAKEILTISSNLNDPYLTNNVSKSQETHMICIGDSITAEKNTITCNGRILFINDSPTIYMPPIYTEDTNGKQTISPSYTAWPKMFIGYNNGATTYQYVPNTTLSESPWGWYPKDDKDQTPLTDKVSNYKISYEKSK